METLKRHRVTVVLVALGVILAGLVFWRLKGDEQARALPRRTGGEPLVGVIQPQRKDLEVKLSYTADILASKQAAIFSKVSGYIQRMAADRGDFVAAGQLLVEIEHSELQATAEQARAALVSSQASLRVAQSSLESIRANLANHQANLLKAQAVLANDMRQYERMKNLHAQGIVSAVEMDNTRTTYESSQASLRAAEAQVEVARAQIGTGDSQVGLARAQVSQQEATLKLALNSLANAQILAPFSGYVAQRNLDIGAAVSAQAAATSNSSVPIMVIQDIEAVKVRVETSEREIGRIRVGNPVRVSVDASPGQVFTGTVTRIVSALDPRTRTNGVEVDIPNPGRRLKPGMYARVEIITKTRKQAQLIPVEALKLDEARPAVFVARDGTVVTVPVELGAQDGTFVEVVRGLTGTEAVILQGKELVKDGQKVRAVPAKQY